MFITHSTLVNNGDFCMQEDHSTQVNNSDFCMQEDFCGTKGNRKLWKVNFTKKLKFQIKHYSSQLK